MGTYTFSFPSDVDDAGWMWFGPVAVSGWKRENAVMSGTYMRPGGSYSQFLNEGETIPFRLLFVQSEADWLLQLKVTGPSGNEIMNKFYGDPQVSANGQFLVDCSNVESYFPVIQAPAAKLTSKFPSPSSTSPRGLRWEYYRMDVGNAAGNIAYNTGTNLDALAVSYETCAKSRVSIQRSLDGQTPILSGTTTSPLIYGGCGPIYGQGASPNCSEEWRLIQHFGYFKPSSPGPYTFTFTNANDHAYLWLGDKAVTDFDASNANLVSWYTAPAQSVNYNVEKEGDLILIRVVFVAAESGSE